MRIHATYNHQPELFHYPSFSGKVDIHPLIPRGGMPKKYFATIWLSVCDKKDGKKSKDDAGRWCAIKVMYLSISSMPVRWMASLFFFPFFEIDRI
jgi:hypothetical protein